MYRSIYKNARIITGAGNIIENGMIIVEHSQTEFENPGSEGKPIKVAPSLKDTLVFVGEGGEYSEIKDNDEVIDLSECTVLPGLINCATRLDTLNSAANDHMDNIGIAYRTYIAYRNASEALNCGVTTLKAVGMPNNIDMGLRDAINKTMFFGPTIIATGPTYAITNGRGHKVYGMIQESGCDALRTQARIHISRGISGITIQVTGDRLDTLNGEYHKEMNDDEINTLTKQARGSEKPVTANASGNLSINSCIKAGVDCIQEGYRMNIDTIKKLKEKNISYVPCLVTSQGKDIQSEHMEVASNAIKEGVQIAVGTQMLSSEPIDGTVAIIREMELLVEAGMTPIQSIEAATVIAGKTIHCQAGLLQIGKTPDFIAVEGKPDKDIKDMRNIVMTVKNGRRAFFTFNQIKERQFHIHAPLYDVNGGTTNDWTMGALKHIKDPETMNVMWNLVKEI